MGTKAARMARPSLGADGNVLEIGVRAAQAARGRHRLVVGGVDPAGLRVNQAQKGVGVGGFELGKAPVLQHQSRQLMIGGQGGEHLHIRGIGGFLDGFFLGGQLELVKQNPAQLLGGIDIERLPGQVMDLALQLLDPAGEIP